MTTYYKHFDIFQSILHSSRGHIANAMPFPFSFSHHFFFFCFFFSFLSFFRINRYTHNNRIYTYPNHIHILALCIPYSLQMIPFMCWKQNCRKFTMCAFGLSFLVVAISNVYWFEQMIFTKFGTVCVCVCVWFLHACSRFKVEIERISYPIYTLGGESIHLNFVFNKQFDAFHDKHFH